MSMSLKDHRDELIDGFTKAVDEMIRCSEEHPRTQGIEPMGVKSTIKVVYKNTKTEIGCNPEWEFVGTPGNGSAAT
jgi:hypothetical protein